MTFSIRSRAKINLHLNVLAKRTDAYHDIVSVLQTIDLEDELLFDKLDSRAIELTSSARDVPLDASNLVWRAIDTVKNHYPPDRIPGFSVEIRKQIPIGAGLGGGSADAAATFSALNSLCDLHLTADEIRQFAEQVGMDVPFLLQGGTMRAAGRGEILQPLRNNAQYWVVVVFPGFSISTRKAYELLDASPLSAPALNDDAVVSALENGDVEQVGRCLYNSFERVLIPHYPILGEIKQDLLKHGCSGALVSGSGSSVFGIIPEKGKAELIVAELQEKHPFVRCCSPTKEAISATR
jgi:4-diphosphocytidyl-2-C-methyl-D-erythritol kinase